MPPPREPLVYPAHMQAIPFPATEAEAARAVCDRIATMLETDLGTRADLVRRATTDWEGRYRTEFDETWRIQGYRLNSEKESLRRLAGALSTAIADAEAMNTTRAGLREDHREEHAAPTGTGPI